MKMKQLFPSVAVVAASALLLAGCKPKNMVAPPADTNLQTSVDASYALFRITDIEMMGAFISDNIFTPKFYTNFPGASDAIRVTQDVQAPQVTLGFAQDGTNCVDGRFRKGTVEVERWIDTDYNPLANGNSLYYRRMGYAGRLTLSDYSVDGWSIVTKDGAKCVILNRLQTNVFDPKTVKLSWSVKGNFIITKDNQTMTCNVDLVKTLENSSDPNVYPYADQTKSINWTLAKVSYYGKVSGVGLDGNAYTMDISQANAITRDFTCSPDLASVNGNGSVSPALSEFHPFKDGLALFNTGNLYQREIYYGGSETAGQGQCDNSGAIVIKGISYPVDFKK